MPLEPLPRCRPHATPLRTSAQQMLRGRAYDGMKLSPRSDVDANADDTFPLCFLKASSTVPSA